ncbi:ATP-binding protein [Corynebacterium hylobatis]|uniref:ATP-binding protein n=1 Tax=Corynebacterium hylobatis TaxID=1859290 RepID=A0A3S0HIS3_9CORY|nr:ATP-binding protein [Corynebacterium hylobatis]RSZ65431.1 ATP-binding protein [Corynebacterium hylobatis]
MPNRLSVAPSARRLTKSLRDIGYSFESAVADLVDNSVAAGADRIVIEIHFEGRGSYLTIIDNGAGMHEEQINEAMRFGSRREYEDGDLGRYGLGLKTASLSQCRRLEVVSRGNRLSSPVARAIDLDFIQAVDDWVTLDISEEAEALVSASLITGDSGSVVVWRKLDRLLPAKSPEGGWARRRIEGLAPKLEAHLSMVFHRFLSGESGSRISISVNGTELEPWDPFGRDEAATQALDVDEFEIEHGDVSDTVTLRRYLLPSRKDYSSREAFEHASGPEKWNRQQGLYIYRANRLVQWGGWAGIRTIDEHTKSARASLDFGTTLDEAFNINVAKMRVNLPGQLRKMMSRPVNELCIAADAAYRRNNQRTVTEDLAAPKKPFAPSGDESGAAIGLALRTAAARTGNFEALEAISTLIKTEMPELARHLGFD